MTHDYAQDAPCLDALVPRARRAIWGCSAPRAARAGCSPRPGLDDDAPPFLHAPIGLDIGAETPRRSRSRSRPSPAAFAGRAGVLARARGADPRGGRGARGTPGVVRTPRVVAGMRALVARRGWRACDRRQCLTSGSCRGRVRRAWAARSSCSSSTCAAGAPGRRWRAQATYCAPVVVLGRSAAEVAARAAAAPDSRSRSTSAGSGRHGRIDRRWRRARRARRHGNAGSRSRTSRSWTRRRCAPSARRPGARRDGRSPPRYAGTIGVPACFTRNFFDRCSARGA